MEQLPEITQEMSDVPIKQKKYYKQVPMCF